MCFFLRLPWLKASSDNRKATSILYFFQCTSCNDTVSMMNLANSFVSQKVEKKTRGSAILVLILTNRGEMIEGVEVVGKSDHGIQHNAGKS